ncbi:hypothetical protein GH714_017440 [Hevea brasiliensis]|uniref:Uncharacterized protein n=1 Tax=Hevea brasiliensis TaxID=3981 RepID=A0A6A6MF00_HEVBR|nr:hypothetical protein GH714_017440 [Hevea brasiliensis]
MTADVNVSENVSTSETEDKGGLDMSSYEDLPTPAADCNGVKDGNGNAEDDPDASYVFVAGNDTVPDEPADSADLNGKYEPVYNVVSDDNDIENEAAESEVDHVIEDVKAAAVEGDASSPLNIVVTSNDGKEGDDDAVEVSNGTVPIVGPEALDDQREVEEGNVNLDSPGGLKGTQDLSEAVEPEPEFLQVKFGDAKAGKENSMESIVSKESQVKTSTDVAESEPNQSGNVELTISADVAESELNQSGVLEVERSSQLEPNQSGNIVVTNSDDVAELEPNQSVSVEVTSGADVAESEPNQSSIAKTRLNVASQDTSQQNSSLKEIETLISCNAEIGRNEAPTSLDTENGKSSPCTRDNDTIGYPTNEITETVVQLKSEAVHGHITCDNGEYLPTDHQESVSQTIANDFAHASQTTTEGNKPSEVVRMIVHHNVAVEKINDDMRTETLVEKLDVNSSENVGSCSIGDREVVIEPGRSHLVTDTEPSCPFNDAETEVETDSTAIESREKVSTFSSDEVDKEIEVSLGAAKCVGSNSVSVER